MLKARHTMIIIVIFFLKFAVKIKATSLQTSKCESGVHENSDTHEKTDRHLKKIK